MTNISEESLDRFKKICEDQGIKYDSEAEYREAANNIVGFFDVLIKMDQEEQIRQRRLEDEPEGFPLEGDGRNCPLCGRHYEGEDLWYDKWGFKCLDCQEALRKKIVPGYVFKDYRNEKHITDSKLARVSDLHIRTVRKLIQRGDIKARKLPHGLYLILKRDNPNITNVLADTKN